MGFSVGVAASFLITMLVITEWERRSVDEGFIILDGDKYRLERVD